MCARASAQHSPRGRGDAPSRTLAITLLAVLLAAIPLQVLAPAASAQGPFDAANVSFDRSPAAYLEGEKVEIRMSGASSGMRTLVWCDACPDSEKTYEAETQSTLVFPDDFGPEARNDRQPKWNGSWSVEVVLGSSLVARGSFRVMLVDVFNYRDETPHVSTILNFQSAGLTPGAEYQFHVRHRTKDGTFETRFLKDVVAAPSGIASTFWVVDETESEGFRCPGLPREFCRYYEITVKGPGKADERQGFVMQPATTGVRLIRTEPVNGGPEAFQRTMNVSRILEIEYPFGYRVTPEDMQRATNPDGVVRMAVERFEGDNREATLETRAKVNAIFDDATDLWYVDWAIPRNETLRVDYRYRLVLLEQEDKYGNRLPRVPVANFTVTSALLSPRIVESPLEVERLDLAKVVLALRYHDGSPLEPGDNRTRLRGCFVKDDPGVNSCGAGFGADVEYWEDGLWNFTYRFPRDYPDLSNHRFLFEGGAANSGVEHNGQDRWGNTFQDWMSAPFRVAPAKLRIDLQTTVAGEDRNATRGWDRGDKVDITAHITYPDGSPFNASVNELARDRIQVLVTKRGQDDALAGDFTMNLTNVDKRSSRWTGSFTLPRNAAATPVGNWTLGFRVRDNLTPANANDTQFVRSVHTAEIEVTTTKEPPRRSATGSDVPWRFRLVYADGTSVTPNDLGTDFFVRVVRVNALQFTGASVSGALYPTFDPARDEWHVDWVVPNLLFQGEYAFKPVGRDRHGNVVDRNALSRPFETFTAEFERATITEPVTRVERGDSVMVVFDGRDGDLDFEPRNMSDPPVIQVQRFDDARGEWVVEHRDVRVADEGGSDHVGRFETRFDTALGLYRFHLRGRDAEFNLVNGTSSTFTIVPTNVSRSLFLPPPERVAKGQLISWTLQREVGDRVLNAPVFFNGRPITEPGNLLGGQGVVAGPLSTTGPDRFNFSWRVPFGLDSGDYSFQVLGRDAFGNTIHVDVPPVRAEPSVLTGRILGNPERVVTRGSDVTFLFAITYPNGDYFVAQGNPRVLVMNESGLVAQARLVNTGLSFEATWTPGATADLADHWFEVTGVDDGGNVFPALASGKFRLSPGVVERSFDLNPQLGYERLQTVNAEVLARPEDTFIAFTLQYLGDASILSQALVGRVDGDTIANLEHEVDATTGRYVVNWVTARDTKPGAYRIAFTGQDTHGNEFRGESEPFTLEETVLLPAFNDPLGNDAFGPGKTVEFTFTVTYPTSRSARVTDETVSPDARILWDGSPVLQRPSLTFDATRGVWVATWQVPEDLPPGTYELMVAGEDDSGNEIVMRRSQPLEYEGPPAVRGLMRMVPDAGVPVTLVFALVAAVLLGARRREA